MMRSMYSGVSGLRVHQTKMDVIGNNIANVNTLGFKSSRVTFSEVFNQTLQSATSPNENLGGRNPMQIGLGTTVSSIDVDMSEGASQRTDNPLDLKISGDSFFVVSNATGNKFTRAGAFKLDKSGNLINSDGMFLMGWGVDNATNTIKKDTVSKLQILKSENLYADPQQTTAVTVSGNIDKNDSNYATTGTGRVLQISFYDSLGYAYTVDATVKATATPYQYTIDIPVDAKDSNQNTITNAFALAGSLTIQFDSTTGKVTTTPATISMTGGTGLDSLNPATPLVIDFSGVTQLAGNDNITAVKGNTDGLNGGYAPGTLNDFEIGGDGKILGKYTNSTTRLLGQIAVATFKNPAGLQKIGDNLFEATANSGDFNNVGEDITANGGKFVSGVLEMSNVDLSREFTEMITTQRGFQANSRIITSSDELLQELVNLKR